MRNAKMRNMPERKVWLVAADMGYGHQRAARPLLSLAAEGRILTANTYSGIPQSDRNTWLRTERIYNLISRWKGRSWLGEQAFRAFDVFQGLDDFYPLHDQSAPTVQIRQIMQRIRKGWGRHLVEQLLRQPLPVVTTYFIVGHMAEYWNYPAPVYVVVTDSDIARAWAPLEPAESKLFYLASTERSARRLEAYGVKKERIAVTGFPLPESLLGPRETKAKECLRRRLIRLDPQGKLESYASGWIRQHAGKVERTPAALRQPVAVTFAVGGAGAQLEQAAKVILSLAPLVRQRKLVLNLVAGVSEDAAKHFERSVGRANLDNFLGGAVRILRAPTKEEYFTAFEELLAATDVLWTKPSELSFYPALGIPLVLTPPVGAHEVRNKEWLLSLGAAVEELEPSAAHQWFPDLIESGRLAEAALAGFAKMERHGTAHIRDLLHSHNPWRGSY